MLAELEQKKKIWNEGQLWVIDGEIINLDYALISHPKLQRLLKTKAKKLNIEDVLYMKYVDSVNQAVVEIAETEKYFELKKIGKRKVLKIMG